MNFLKGLTKLSDSVYFTFYTAFYFWNRDCMDEKCVSKVEKTVLKIAFKQNFFSNITGKKTLNIAKYSYYLLLYSFYALKRPKYLLSVFPCPCHITYRTCRASTLTQPDEPVALCVRVGVCQLLCVHVCIEVIICTPKGS